MLKKLLWMFAVVLATSAPLGAHAAVDVNKADQATLETIKGIGPGVSTRILDERKKGPFKDWGDLVDRVKGVGEGNAARFSKEGLTVNGGTFTPSENAGKADKKGKFGKAATDAKVPEKKDKS